MPSFFKLLLIIIIVSNNCYAQKEASVWYFGRNAGLSFFSGSPVVLTDGKINTDEGVASICDENGLLLFYTDGISVWNRQHTTMPGGQGLLGNYSSSQAAIIVPQINDPQRYYIFTTTDLGKPAGFNYSIVNMALDNGRGDIETKNIPLLSPVTEKLTAVKHCNGRDVWVIVHGFNSNAFYAYLITENGVSTTPVISAAGTFVSNASGENAIGCMKASPDGKKIAIAHKRIGVDLLDFDNTTGIISNSRSVFLPTESYGSYRGAYGVEFSPNSSLLYISADYFDYTDIGESSIVLQYNVTQGDITTIQASKQIIYKQQAYYYAENFGTLQTAPDGKIYMAEMGQPFLSVINSPNTQGPGCNFVHAQLPTHYSTGGRSTYGLPGFIQSYWKPSYTFRGECTGNIIYFDYEKTREEIAVKWDFGDPASGTDNFSNVDSSQHQFSSDGVYQVKLIRYTSCGSDTISKSVAVGAGRINLGNDTVLCGTNQFILKPETISNRSTFLWNDGSTGTELRATKTGIYWLQLTNNTNGCTTRDSIILSFNPIPVFSLGGDLNKCENDRVVLGTNISGANYLWSTGATSSQLAVTQTGQYWLQVDANTCNFRDSVEIRFNKYPVVDLGRDAELCEGNELVLNLQNPGMQYLWQDFTTNQSLVVKGSGTFWATVDNSGCATSDTIRIKFVSPPNFTIGNDTAICEASSFTLEPNVSKGTDLKYLWSTGSTASSLRISQPGKYALTLTNQCGTLTDELAVVNGPCKIYFPSAFTPNNDGINDLAKASFANNIEDFRLQIYNRWGEIVFSTKDIKQGWNGRYKGQLQPNDAFAWIIQYKDANEKMMTTIKGTIILIR